MVPCERFRPIVERWLTEYEDLEHAWQSLAGQSPHHADTWRLRLGPTGLERRDRRSWLLPLELPAEKVDQFLTAAGLTHLWYSELRDLLPVEERVSDEEFDETCACCGRWIDWSRGDRGIRVELHRPRKWREWWSVCSWCLVEHYPASGFGQLDLETLRKLYRRYLDHDVGIGELGRSYFEAHETTFKHAGACASSLSQGWRRNGWPTRRNGLQQHLASKRRGPRRQPPAKIGETDLRRMHRLHLSAGLSIRQIAIQLHDRYGYRHEKHMTSEISRGWKILGLSARDRIEQTVLSSTKHGRKRRYQKGTASADYKRWLKRSRGEQYDEPCTATTARGKPCQGRAQIGKDVCQSHDPERQEQLRDQLAAMRSRCSLFDPERLEPMAPLRTEMAACFDALGSWKPLAAALGMPNRELATFARQKQRQRIAKVRASEIRVAIASVMPSAPAQREALAA